MDGEAIFLKFCYLKKTSINPVYKVSALPGHYPGVSATTIGGYNIGVNKYSKEERRDAIVTVLKFATSLDMQRKLVNDFRIISGISQLYEPTEEICTVDPDLCDLYQHLQPIPRPISKTDDYDTYTEKFKHYLYEYLYGDKSASEMLKEVDDITRIYYVPIKSNVGVLLTTLYFLIFLIYLSSLYFITDKRFRLTFTFLPKEFWVLMMTGFSLVLVISYVDLMKASVFLCHFKTYLQSLAITFMMVPMFFKLVVNFPESNGLSTWVNNHRYLFLLGFVGFDLVLTSLMLIHPYHLKDIMVTHGKNFQICELGSGVSTVAVYILGIFYCGVILATLILTFAEWNIDETYYALRHYCSSFLINAIILFIFLVMKHLGASEFNSYYVVRQSLFILFSVSNYAFSFGIKILWTLLSGKEESKINIHQSRISSKPYQQDSRDFTSSQSSSTIRTKFIEKLKGYHLQTSLSSQDFLNSQDPTSNNAITCSVTSPSYFASSNNELNSTNTNIAR